MADLTHFLSLAFFLVLLLTAFAGLPDLAIGKSVKALFQSGRPYAQLF